MIFQDKFPINSVAMSENEAFFSFDGTNNEETTSIISEKELMKDSCGNIAVNINLWSSLSMYHSFETYIIYYVHRGSFCIHIDEMHTTHICAGDMCIFPPEIIHKISADNKGDRQESQNGLISIVIPADSLRQVFGKILNVPNSISDYLASAIHIKKHKNYMLLRGGNGKGTIIADNLFNNIELLNRDKLSSVIAEQMINILLITYAKDENCRVEYPSATAQSTDIMQNIINYIRMNFKTVSLDELSEKFHYRKTYLCTLIKNYTGMTFNEYITNEKLDYVCRQLTTTDKKIKQILDEAGYTTPEHFYRVFKKKFGVSPAKYRNEK